MSDVVLDEAGARRLTMRIALQLDTIASNVEQVVELIDQARVENIHQQLGYASWPAYVKAEFGGRLDRLKRAERRPLVEVLAGTGMSTRAIASVVGVHHDTVASDIRAAESGVGNPTPDRGLPGQDLDEMLVLADSTDEQFETALDAARDDGDLSRDNVVKHLPGRKVTGTDGKTYNTGPSKRRRRALPDAYWTAVYDLEKVVARLVKLTEDDRFGANRDGLGDRHQQVVLRLAGDLEGVADLLGGGPR